MTDWGSNKADKKERTNYHDLHLCPEGKEQLYLNNIAPEKCID